MPAQPTIRADQRSVFARQPGVPWWGAILIAVALTLAGMGVEAGLGHQELGGPFAIGYSLGCVIAVLTVRQSGVFTAVIQPPLLLFVAVPLSYYLFHNSEFSGLKEIAITCGYPLIERFPLMLFTTSAVLLIGLVRWYLAMSRPAVRDAAPSRATQPAGLLAGLTTKLSSAFAGTGSVDEKPGQRAARPRHVADRPTDGKRPRKPQRRTPERSRGSRRVEEVPPQRRRRDPGRRPADESAAGAPRRRTPDPRDTRDPRRTPPPSRREPRERREYREPYPQRPVRGSRYEPHETGRGYRPHPVYPPYPPDPRRRPVPGRDETHHPISRVRYRDSDPSDYRGR